MPVQRSAKLRCSLIRLNCKIGVNFLIITPCFSYKGNSERLKLIPQQVVPPLEVLLAASVYCPQLIFFRAFIV